MKNLVYLCVVLTLSLFSCSNSSPSDVEKDESETIAKEVLSIQQQVEKLNAQTGWTLAPSMDKFGDMSKEKNTIIGLFNGTYKNSATVNQKLKVKMQPSPNNSFITTFYEQSLSGPPATLPNKKMINIEVKKANGEIVEVEQLFLNNMMGGTSNSQFYDLIINSNEPVKILVDLSKASEYENTVYTFTVDPKGLKELIKKS